MLLKEHQICNRKLFFVHHKKYTSGFRSSPPKGFLGKGILKICSKFILEHSFQSVISIKFICNFVKITLRHGCSPVILLHIFRTHFPKNISGGLLLSFCDFIWKERTHKPSKVATVKNFFSSVCYWYNMFRLMFFISCDDLKTLRFLFLNVYRYLELFFRTPWSCFF